MMGRAIVATAGVLALAGCINLGAKLPAQLLNLTPAATAAAGSGASGTSDSALAVIDIQAPQKLDVTRVPVTTSGSSLAYLKDAQWVEKPARLFGRLLSDTIRADGKHLVVSSSDAQEAAATRLSGTLSAMDYDAAQGAVIVRYDALLRTPDGRIQTHRFESKITGVPAQAEPVGDALNRAANDVARQVADWVG